MVFPNPIDKRLDFVRKQYGQEAYEKTRSIVAANLGIAESDIAPGMRVDWEKFIPWLGKQVHKLLKQGPRAASELGRLERGFLASVQPFMVKKKGRQADIARLSPKRARQFAGRQQRAVGEARGEQAKKLGYKEVARLGNGYTAVMAVIDPKAPGFSGIVHPSTRDVRRKAYKEWITQYAPFQQWLGVELGNCLQFYKVNFQPHGESQFNIQRAGGKLYGILGPKGKPVAAILTNVDGSIRETNGPGNRSPSEKDQEYVDRFIQKHLKQKGKDTDTAFHPPEGFSPQVSGVIEYLLDFWPENDIHKRRRFLRKAQGYARQQGADFSNVWPRFAIYILEESQYSSLNTIKEMHNYPSQEKAVIRVIHQAVKFCRANEPWAPEAGEPESEKSRMLRVAANEAQAKGAPEEDEGVDPLVKSALGMVRGTFRAASGRARYAGDSARAAVHDAIEGAGWAEWYSAESSATAETAAAKAAARADFANKLLELMRDAARAGGGAQPRRGRAGNPTGARALVKECQRLWEHYCERPNKTRLKAVVRHCEAMKKSKATTVARERRNCMQCVRAEARANKWEV